MLAWCDPVSPCASPERQNVAHKVVGRSGSCVVCRVWIVSWISSHLVVVPIADGITYQVLLCVVCSPLSFPPLTLLPPISSLWSSTDFFCPRHRIQPSGLVPHSSCPCWSCIECIYIPVNGAFSLLDGAIARRPKRASSKPRIFKGWQFESPTRASHQGPSRSLSGLTLEVS